LILRIIYRCFDQNFPFWHEHPRSSFAIQDVIDTAIGPRPIKGELVTVWEEDILEVIPSKNELPLSITAEASTSNTPVSATVSEATEITNTINVNVIKDTLECIQIDEPDPNTTSAELAVIESSTIVVTTENDIESGAFDASKVFTGSVPIDTDQGYKYLKRWRRRKLCAFCNDDDDTSEELGHFIGPFVIATFNKNGVEKKRSFWAHDSCARYSPEVFCTPEGKWYNVTLALRRGRGMVKYINKYKRVRIRFINSFCIKSDVMAAKRKVLLLDVLNQSAIRVSICHVLKNQ
jgi:hypothetical protein